MKTNSFRLNLVAAAVVSLIGVNAFAQTTDNVGFFSSTGFTSNLGDVTTTLAPGAVEMADAVGTASYQINQVLLTQTASGNFSQLSNTGLLIEIGGSQITLGGTGGDVVASGNIKAASFSSVDGPTETQVTPGNLNLTDATGSSLLGVGTLSLSQTTGEATTLSSNGITVDDGAGGVVNLGSTGISGGPGEVTATGRVTSGGLTSVNGNGLTSSVLSDAADGSRGLTVAGTGTATNTTLTGGGTTAATTTTLTLNETTASLLNGVGIGHGLTIGANSTTLSGGTTSSVLTLNNTDTNITVNGSQMLNLDQAAATTTLGVAATTNNTITGLSNQLTASGQNTLTGATGNSVTATTGDNTIASTLGANTLNAGTMNTLTGATGNSVTATAGTNALTATGVGGTNTLTALSNTIDATTGANTISAGTSNSVSATTSNTLTAGTDNNINALTGTNALNALTNIATANTNTIQTTNNALASLTVSQNVAGTVGNISGTATGTNTLTGGTGNTITATTGNNTIAATAGANNITAGTTNTVSALTSSTVIGNNARMVLSNNSSVIGVTGGSSLTATNTSASLVTANSGGLVITDALPLTTNGQAVLTGGTAAAGTNMTLNNSGVSFAQNTTNAPVRVSGVADGVFNYDAANMGQIRQLEKQLSRGIAASVASASIPVADAGKEMSVGVALGHYNSESAIAFGVNYRFSPVGMIRANIGTSLSSGGSTTFGIGAGWSW